MNETKRVTIKELSKIIGVSTTTITNALTGQPNVSEKKREEIIRKAKELGYKPNQYARAMVRNGFKIGIVLAEEPHEFLTYVRQGIEECLEELADYKIEGIFATYSNHNAHAEFKDALVNILSQGVTGLIIGSSFDISGYIDILREAYSVKNIPTVLLHRDLEGETFSGHITSDGNTIGRMAAEVISMSYPKGTKVAAITTRKEFPPHMVSLNAFKEECAERGLKVCAVYENGDSKQETYKCTQRIITENPDCKVIYVTSYDSVSACRCIRNMGLEKKVKVIAHDIYPGMVKYMEKGMMLASIYQNPIQMGKQSILTAFNHISGDKSMSGTMKIRPELILKCNMQNFPELEGNSRG